VGDGRGAEGGCVAAEVGREAGFEAFDAGGLARHVAER
jgi:hypothetical protein